MPESSIDPPLPMLAVGTNGLRLKKGSVWAPQEPGKRPPPPPQLGVEGQGLDEHGPGATPREGAGHPVPRPPSSRTGVASPARLGRSSPQASPPASARPKGLVSGSIATQKKQEVISPVNLTLDTPITTRRLAPAAQAPSSLLIPSPSSKLAGNGGAADADLRPGAITGSSRSTSTSTSKDGPAVIGAPGTASAAGDAARPRGGAEEPPPGMARGGAEEIAWLRSLLSEGSAAYEQLEGRMQTVEQESHAIRSSLATLQQEQEQQQRQRQQQPEGTGSFTKKAGGGDGGGGGSGEGSPNSSPAPPGRRIMQRRGTVTMLLPPGQRPPDKQAGQKKRQERKKTARGAFGEDSSDDDGDVSAGKYTPGNAMPLEFHEKTKEMEASMIAALKKKAPFDAHDDADLARLVAAMAPVEFAEGVDVVRQGEAGDLAYWVEEGELTVLADGKEVDTISAHAVFGEVALVYDLTRTATIRTKTRARMWLLHRHMFQHILRNRHIEARKAKFAFLRTVKIFAKLSSRQISRVADVADTVTFDADDVIIAQGDQADSMYLIEEGQAVVSQKQDGVGGAGSSQHGSASGEGGEGGEGEEGAAASEPSLLRILKPGDYFGEKALLTDGTLRTATVTAASQVTCLRLDQQSFTELLGELREELIRRAPKDDRPAQKQPPPPPPPPPPPRAVPLPSVPLRVAVISTDHHLHRIADIDALTPRQSLLQPLRELDAEIGFLPASDPYSYEGDAAVRRQARHIRLSEQLSVVEANLRAIAARTDFLHKDNGRRLTEVRLALSEALWEIMPAHGSQRALRSPLAHGSGGTGGGFAKRPLGLGGARDAAAAAASEVECELVCLEKAVGELGKAQTILAPLINGDVFGGDLPRDELREAERLIAAAAASLRLADPDRPMSPDETLAVLRGESVRWRARVTDAGSRRLYTGPIAGRGGSGRDESIRGR